MFHKTITVFLYQSILVLNAVTANCCELLLNSYIDLWRFNTFCWSMAMVSIGFSAWLLFLSEIHESTKEKANLENV